MNGDTLIQNVQLFIEGLPRPTVQKDITEAFVLRLVNIVRIGYYLHCDSRSK